MTTMLAAPLGSTLDTGSGAFATNRADVLEQLAVIDGLLDEAEAGGGPSRMDRLRSQGKMPVRERIALALDPDSPFLEISPLAAFGSDYTIGGGMIVGIGVIASTECVILANDPSVLGGALTPYAAKKWSRALEIARDNHMPYVSFVESAGADLRVQTDGGGGRRVQTEHFAETGRFFYELIEL
jgi:acyl-CoA carboxylase subunit beta